MSFDAHKWAGTGQHEVATLGVRRKMLGTTAPLDVSEVAALKDRFKDIHVIGSHDLARSLLEAAVRHGADVPAGFRFTQSPQAFLTGAISVAYERADPRHRHKSRVAAPWAKAPPRISPAVVPPCSLASTLRGLVLVLRDKRQAGVQSPGQLQERITGGIAQAALYAAYVSLLYTPN